MNDNNPFSNWGRSGIMVAWTVKAGRNLAAEADETVKVGMPRLEA